MRNTARRLQNLACVVALIGLVIGATATPAAAQETFGGFLSAPQAAGAEKPVMNVKARELQYDTNADTVTAIGEVHIAYGERRLQADRVVYDRASKRVRATGNVQVTEADGTVTYADTFDLTDDFRDGYVNSLRISTWDKLRLVATRAERADGNVTVFENGVYTACEPCADDPARPPLWQIKAARIIHNQAEKMMYFEDARFEFLGHSIAYLPYLSAADPSVKRKTGLLAPLYFSKSDTGMGVRLPYFINLAPNYDLTLTPGFTTRQGPTMDAAWRHRLISGAYEIRAAGAFQSDPDRYTDPSQNRDFRGVATSKGEFWLNERWRWGWDGGLISDKYFLQDYKPTVRNPEYEITSTLYLTGSGSKSWFDARLYHFYGLTLEDEQKQLPWVHPVIDYNYIVDRPVLGGELGWNINFTSLSRERPDFDKITGALTCDGSIANTTRADCLQRGFAGAYSRASADVYWKRTFTDTFGQQWTPFAYLRGDLAWSSADDSMAPVQLVNGNDSFQARGIAAAGLDYRYPFISVSSFGTQVIEPIAQIIVRPRLQQTADFPNEDAQSLIFDDTNLFDWDKFSGYDRLEDGSRLNYGLQYTLRTPGGSYVNASFGQSYALGGYSAYMTGDMANTGLQSGLDDKRSDYVGRVYVQPFSDFALLSSFRLDKDDLSLKRNEISAIGTFGNMRADIGYGFYAGQPLLGLEEREGVRANTAFRLGENWLVRSGALYDIDSKRLSTGYAGLTYIDDCIAAGLEIGRSYDQVSRKSDTSISFQLSLRGITDMGSPEQFKHDIWNDGFIQR